MIGPTPSKIGFNKQTKVQTREYLRTKLLPAVRRLVDGLCESTTDDDHPDIVAVRYPNSFSESYLRPEIQLEVGPLPAWFPNARYSITPYAAEAFPRVFEVPAA